MFQKYNDITFTLNWINQTITPTSVTVVREGDVKGRTLVFNVTDGKLPIDLSTSTAVLYWKHTVMHVSGMAEATTNAQGQVIVPVPTAMQHAVGEVEANLRITDSTGTQIVSTRTLRLYVESSGIDLTTPLSTDQYSALDSMVAEVQSLADLENTLSSMDSAMVKTVNYNAPDSGGNVELTGDSIIVGSGNFSPVSTTLGSLAVVNAIQDGNLSNAESSLSAQIIAGDIDVLSNANSYTDYAASSAGSSALSSANSYTDSVTSLQSSVIASSVANLTGDDFAVGSNNPLTIDSAINQIQVAQSATTATIGTLGDMAYRNSGTTVGDGVVVQSNGQIAASLVPPAPLMTTFVGLDANKTTQTTAVQGDIYVATDTSTTYILQQAPATVASNWVALTTPTTGVISVNGQTGAVSLTSSDGSVQVIGNDFTVDWTKAPLPHITVLPDGADLNTYVGDSVIGYSAQGLTSVVNAPQSISPQNFTMIYRGTFDPITNPAGTGTQTLYYADGTGWWRTVMGGTWGAWQQVISGVDLTNVYNYVLSYADSTASSNASSAQSAAISTASSATSSAVSSEAVVRSIADQSLATNIAANSTAIAANSTAIAANSAAISNEVVARSVGDSSLAVNISANSTAISSVATSASSGIASNASTAGANSTAIASIVAGTTTVGKANTAIANAVQTGTNLDFNTYTTAGTYWLPSSLGTYVNYPSVLAQLPPFQPTGYKLIVTPDPAGNIWQESIQTDQGNNFADQRFARVFHATSAIWGAWNRYPTSLAGNQIVTTITATSTTNLDTLSQQNIYVPSTVTPAGTAPWSGVNYMVVQYFSTSALQAQMAINLATNTTVTRTYNGSSWSAWSAVGKGVYASFLQTTSQAITTTSPTALTGWSTQVSDPNVSVTGSTFTINQIGMYNIITNLGTTSTNNVTCNAKVTPISNCTVAENNQATILANNNNLNAIPNGDNMITLNVTAVPATFSFSSVYSYNSFSTGTTPSYGVLQQPSLIIKLASMAMRNINSTAPVNTYNSSPPASGVVGHFNSTTNGTGVTGYNVELQSGLTGQALTPMSFTIQGQSVSGQGQQLFGSATNLRPIQDTMINLAQQPNTSATGAPGYFRNIIVQANGNVYYFVESAPTTYTIDSFDGAASGSFISTN